MDSYFLVLPLPLSVRSRLASFCFGLPQVKWVEEENFHLALRTWGPLSESSQADIQQRLKTLFFLPFSLLLQGMGHFHSKGNRGILWVGIADNPHLLTLKKEIDRQLKGFPLPAEERLFHPQVTLGFYQRLNPQKLGDYFSAYSAYQSEPLPVTRCLLLRAQQTSKRIIYQTLEEYPASLLATGED